MKWNKICGYSIKVIISGFHPEDGVSESPTHSVSLSLPSRGDTVFTKEKNKIIGGSYYE